MCYNHQYLLFKPQHETHFTVPGTLPRREGRCAVESAYRPGPVTLGWPSGPSSSTWPGLAALRLTTKEGLWLLKPTLPRREDKRGPDRWEDLFKVTLQIRVRPHYEEPQGDARRIIWLHLHVRTHYTFFGISYILRAYCVFNLVEKKEHKTQLLLCRLYVP